MPSNHKSPNPINEQFQQQNMLLQKKIRERIYDWSANNNTYSVFDVKDKGTFHSDR